MKVQVAYLGPARDWAGVEGETFEVEGDGRLDELVAQIVAARPGLGRSLASLRFAVNEEFVAQDAPLADGDEVAVIPPVSGGAADDLVSIVSEPIDAAAVRDHVSGDPAFGGVVTFEGVTRFERHPKHGDLARLEYETYGAMALKQMQKLADQVRSRWAGGRLAMVHRIGSVACGEPSVVIAVASVHRAEAFAACRWLIDTLKTEVPIWKREIWEDGASSWVDPTKKDSP